MRFLILMLFASSVAAETFVVEPIQYDIPESKWGKAIERSNKGKCSEPMALMEVCPSKASLAFDQRITAYKKQLLLAKAAKSKVDKKKVAKHA